MRLASLSRRLAARAGVVAAALAWAFGPGVAADAAPEPAYFSYPFGGEIARIAAGPDGTVYVAGWTTTPDLPASTSSPEPLPIPYYFHVAGFVFVAALAPDGTPRWTSYVRATRPANALGSAVPAISVGPDGAAWIVGNDMIETTRPFAASQPYGHGPYIARFDSEGVLAFASHLGGSEVDSAADVAVTPDGDAVLTGTTYSPDFPGAPSTRGTNHAFVARIAADGSGVVWARRFGDVGENSPAVFRGGDIAIGPQDGTIVFGCVGPAASPGAPATTTLAGPMTLSPPWTNQSTTYVLRLSPDGTTIGGAGVQLGGASGDAHDGSPVTLAVADGGAIVVAGGRATVRLDRGLTRVEASRARKDDLEFVMSRLVAVGGGRAAAIGYVPTNRSPPPEAVFHPGIHVYDAALAEEDRPDLGTLAPRDVAVGPDGALLVAGPWTASAFNVPAGVTPRRGGSFVTKVPLDGSRPPSAARVRIRGPDTADLAWTSDGDAPLRIDLESRQTDADPLDTVVGGTAGGAATAGRISQLVPGSDLEFRVVAVFPSGVRSGVAVNATTPVVPPRGITVTEGAGTDVVVRWNDANGSATFYDVQRRVGVGEWMDVRYDRPFYDRPTPPRTEQPDVVPDGAAPIVYRVRAVLRRTRTPWVMSDPFVPTSTLRVTQTSGRLRAGGAGGHLEVTGTIAPVAGGVLSFDPATQDLRMLYGDALAPREFVVPSGDTGWTEASGVWTWSAARTLSGWGHASEIVLDLPRGAFRVVLDGGWYDFRSHSVAINVAFGDYSGGDVRAWRGSRRRLALR